MKNILFPLFYITLLGCSHTTKTNHVEPTHTETIIIEDNTIINLYDAFGDKNADLIKDFGFSCIMKYKGKTILFDAGTNADIFKNNVEAMNIDLSKVDIAIASHSHFDHINGFDYLLEINPDVTIYFPSDPFWGAELAFDMSGTDPTIVDSLQERMRYFGGDYKNYTFRQTGRFWNANIEFVDKNIEIAPGIKLISTTSTNMGYFNKYPRLDNCDDCEAQNASFNGLKELSLSLESDEGEIVIVGCSHSTIEKIIVEAKRFTGNTIEMLYGGYHLLPYDRETIVGLTNRLTEDHQVQKVAPAHCTGHLAFKLLQDHFNDDYIFAGLGEKINF